MNYEDLMTQLAGCQACDLHQGNRRSVGGLGTVTPLLMGVGRDPGAEEDQKGEPFCGPAGQELRHQLGAMGITRTKMYLTNTLKHKPPGNKERSAKEYDFCGERFLAKEVELLRPKAIVCFGKVAANFFYRHANLPEPTGSLRGRQFTYRGTPVVVTWHPSYIIRQGPGDVQERLRGELQSDLVRALELAGER